MNGLTLDTGALIAYDRADRRIALLLDAAVESQTPITVPAAVLAQAIRNPARQARMSRLARQKNTEVLPLDRGSAIQVGRLLAATRTSDVVDAQVVLCAGLANTTIVTSDPQDMRRLNPRARLIVVA